MIFGIVPFIVELTKYFTLWPGDVIWMGTDGASPDIKHGDVVEIDITGIGTLRNRFVREAPVGHGSLSGRALFPRRTGRSRRRVHLCQSRHRPCVADRGNGALGQGGPQASRNDPVPARGGRGAHGRRLCAGDRARAGRAGSCRCRHRECLHGDPEPVSLPPAGDAVRRPRAAHAARRTDRLARHLCAFRAGPVRYRQHRAALCQMGVFAALGRGGEGSAGARQRLCAQRSAGTGLHDAAARNAGGGMGRGRDAGLSGRRATAACRPAASSRRASRRLRTR